MGIVLEQDSEGSLIGVAGAIGVAQAAELKAMLLAAFVRVQAASLDSGAEVDPGLGAGLMPDPGIGTDPGLDSGAEPGAEPGSNPDINLELSVVSHPQERSGAVSGPDSELDSVGPGVNAGLSEAQDHGEGDGSVMRGAKIRANAVRISVKEATYLDVTAVQLLWAAAAQARLCGIGFEVAGEVPEPVEAALAAAGLQPFLVSVKAA
jgi:hypothetical protein